MIRFIHCMKRRPDVTVAEFREYWNSPEFAAYLERMRAILEPVSMIRNLTFNIELNNELMQERDAEEPYDGILEMWLENADGLQAMNTLDAETLRLEMGEYQKQFVDFSASKRFFTEWEPVAGLG